MTLIAERYQLADRIGSGAMGDVYRAETPAGEMVAVKALRSELVERDPDMLERFKREGQALRDLNHPNIVTMIEAVEHDGMHYLVMQYMPGGDLAGLLEQHSNGLPIQNALHIALDLADALTRAHRLDIIHRDLKPANILLAEDGTPRLTDFGIAHIGGREAITESGMTIGTYAYLSPEGYMSLPLDGRTDIWSLGVVLYEMLSGQRPFQRDSIPATMLAVMNDPLPDLQDIRPEIPDALNDLIYRMLEKKVEARIPSVRLVGAALESLLSGSEAVLADVMDSSHYTVAGGRFDTPTPDVMQRPAHNLPAQATQFIGREHELAELDRLFNQPGTRLVTLLGVGGMGKTRLSIEFGLAQATQFNNGAVFVALDKLDDPHNIVTAIGEAAGYVFNQDTPHEDQLLQILSHKNLLLILDNFEHLIDGATLVADIVAAAPKVSVLVTSREKLNLSGETVYALAGVEFPEWETPADALRYSAVQLFMQSATRARLDFELGQADLPYVARICRLVEGTPLGILLAAAWVDTLSVEEIAEEISGSFEFLESSQRDLPERQRSMRAVFDYSWKLLTQDERQTLARLSVFRGGCSRKAAQSVAQASVRQLTNLVNKSLLHRDLESGRFAIHELIRQFAEQELNVLDEADHIADAHAEYYLTACNARWPDLAGGDQLAALRDMALDFENVRAAWSRGVMQGQQPLLKQAVVPIIFFSVMRTRYHDALDLFDNARQKFETDRSVLWALVSVIIEEILWRSEKRPDSVVIARDALNIAQKANDKHAEAWIQLWHGRQLTYGGEYREAVPILEDSVRAFEQLNDRFGQAWSLHTLGFSYHMLDEQDISDEFSQQCLTIRRDLGDQFGIAMVLNNLSTASEDRDEALQLTEEAYALRKQLGDKQGIAWSGVLFAQFLIERGDLERATKLVEEALSLIEDINHVDTTMWVHVVNFALQLATEEYDEALKTTHFANTLPLTRHDMRLGAVWQYAMVKLAKNGDSVAARQHLKDMEPFLTSTYLKAWALLVAGLILAEEGRHEHAVEFITKAAEEPTLGSRVVGSYVVRTRESLKAALGEEAHAAAVERGHALDIDDAPALMAAESLL